MEDKCVCCGAIIPEGRQVCEDCGKFTDDEFIDDDFIKDLKWYVSRHGGDGSFESNLAEEALALINRQKAEIERLKYNLKAVLEERADHTEAIEEFAERLKAKERKMLDYDEAGFSCMASVIYTETIDNLVKEMTEVKCKDCEYLELELPYAVCSKAYWGVVNPDDSCGKGKRKGGKPRKDVGK